MAACAQVRAATGAPTLTDLFWLLSFDKEVQYFIATGKKTSIGSYE